MRKLDDQTVQEIVSPASGVHITLPNYYAPAKIGLIDPATSDGRVIFFLPWQGNTIAGTTDSPAQVEQHPIPKEEEIEFILNEVRGYLSSDVRVRRGDVLSAWSGLRPLVKDPNAKDTQSLVRNHLIDVSPSGLLTIAGGKWTTYRAMAEETVDRAVREYDLKPERGCITKDVQLVGSQAWNKLMFIKLIQVRFGVVLGLVVGSLVLTFSGFASLAAIRSRGERSSLLARVVCTLLTFTTVPRQVDVARHLAEEYGDRAWGVCSMAKPTGLRFPVHGNRIDPVYPYIDAGALPWFLFRGFLLSDADSPLLNSRAILAIPAFLAFSRLSRLFSPPRSIPRLACHTRPTCSLPTRSITNAPPNPQRSPGPAAANTPPPPST